MRPRYRVWTAVVCVFLFATSVDAGDPKPRKRSIAIEASPTILAKGTECRVQLQPDVQSREKTEQVTYDGTIAETSEDGIMLLVTSEDRRLTHTSPYATRVPFGNRLFRNVGIARSKPKEEKKLWIPNEKILLLTRTDNP
jgi:hypothetical protein